MLPQGRVVVGVVRVVLLHGRCDVLAQLVQQLARLACTVDDADTVSCSIQTTAVPSFEQHHNMR